MRSMVEGAPVVRQASRPTPLPPPFGRSPHPAVAGRDEVERAERAARTNFYFVIASEAKQSRFWAARVWIASSLRSSQ